MCFSNFEKIKILKIKKEKVKKNNFLSLNPIIKNNWFYNLSLQFGRWWWQL